MNDDMNLHFLNEENKGESMESDRSDKIMMPHEKSEVSRRLKDPSSAIVTANLWHNKDIEAASKTINSRI